MSLAIARWFDTYQLTSRVLDLPDLPPDLADQLVDVLDSDETQAALHGLFAVRLAHATAMDAARAREAFRLTLTTGGARGRRYRRNPGRLL